jgi:hypothetical protein
MDAVGNVYCQAWAQQFVVVGKAVATCGYGNTFGTTLVCDFQNIPCKGNTMLVSGTDAEVTDPLAGGGCRFPCQP